MLRKTLSVLLILSVWCCASRLALAQAGSTPSPAPTPSPTSGSPNVNPSQAKLAEKVKAHVAKLGTGPAARIQLTLRDRTKVKGYVSYLDEDYFVVTDEQTGITTRMTYGQVVHIKGGNVNKDKELAIGLVIGLIILFGAGSFKGP